MAELAAAEPAPPETSPPAARVGGLGHPLARRTRAAGRSAGSPWCRPGSPQPTRAEPDRGARSRDRVRQRRARLDPRGARAARAAPRPGDRVLDLGSGSGILAIAAVKLGAARAVGIENDPEANPVARRNAERNGVDATRRVRRWRRRRPRAAPRPRRSPPLQHSPHRQHRAPAGDHRGAAARRPGDLLGHGRAEAASFRLRSRAAGLKRATKWWTRDGGPSPPARRDHRAGAARSGSSGRLAARRWRGAPPARAAGQPGERWRSGTAPDWWASDSGATGEAGGGGRARRVGAAAAGARARCRRGRPRPIRLAGREGGRARCDAPSSRSRPSAPPGSRPGCAGKHLEKLGARRSRPSSRAARRGRRRSKS